MSPLNNNDYFLVGNQADKRTYKSTYDQIQKKIQEDTDAVVIFSINEPTTQSNGEPLIEGALWYNSRRPNEGMFVWNGTNWVPVSSAGGGDTTSGVTQIIAGDNVSIEPENGFGQVTINSIPKTLPTDPENGDLWVDTSTCPPKLHIYSNCGNPDDPEWIVIGPPDIQYLMEDSAGNVFIRGNIFVSNFLHADEEKAGFTGVKNVRVDQYGDVYVTGSLFVKGITESSTFQAVTPVNAVPYDANGDVQIKGNLYVLGDILTQS